MPKELSILFVAALLGKFVKGKKESDLVQQSNRITSWLNKNCGRNGYQIQFYNTDDRSLNLKTLIDNHDTVVVADFSCFKGKAKLLDGLRSKAWAGEIRFASVVDGFDYANDEHFDNFVKQLDAMKRKYGIV